MPNNIFKKINGGLDFAVIFFILSGGAYFFHYILRFNKFIYLLFCVLIYITSFIVRNFLTKQKHKTGFSEIGMFFVSMVFLAYTLSIFNLDPQITEYLPDRLLINSGASFVVLLCANLMSKKESKKLRIFTLLALVMIIIFRTNIDVLFQTYPWIASFIIGTPYIYLLWLLCGVKRSD